MKEWWIKEAQEARAYWLHDQNPKRPHVELTSGKHSDGFFNGGILCAGGDYLNEAGDDFLQLIPDNVLRDIHHVVGPAMGAISIASMFAAKLAGYCDNGRGDCFWSYTVKVADEMGKTVGMKFDRATRPMQGDSVILVEDTITTGQSTEFVARAVLETGATVLPYVLTLMNRSGLTEIGGKQIVALIDQEMPMWAPEDCPLCKLGSTAIRPKGPAEWAALNMHYD